MATSGLFLLLSYLLCSFFNQQQNLSSTVLSRKAPMHSYRQFILNYTPFTQQDWEQLEQCLTKKILPARHLILPSVLANIKKIAEE